MARRDGRIDSVFADMNALQRPGAALLVIDYDQIVCSKCYGLADLATQRPITTDTSFYLASISKQFTAMAIMMLAERGKLSFDDHLPSYFPRFPAWAAGITLRHMLHHTSGLPDYLPFSKGDEFVARDMNGITNEDVLQRATNLPGLEFPVGSRFDYRGTSYVLLAMIVAIVSGQSFADS